jgi:hypothetical protein
MNAHFHCTPHVQQKQFVADFCSGQLDISLIRHFSHSLALPLCCNLLTTLSELDQQRHEVFHRMLPVQAIMSSAVNPLHTVKAAESQSEHLSAGYHFLC